MLVAGFPKQAAPLSLLKGAASPTPLWFPGWEKKGLDAPSASIPLHPQNQSTTNYRS